MEKAHALVNVQDINLLCQHQVCWSFWLKHDLAITLAIFLNDRQQRS